MNRHRFGLRRALWILLPVLGVGAFALPRAMAFGRHHHCQAKSAAEVAEHLEDKLDRLLDRLDATDAQRAAAKAIAIRKAPELFAVMGEGREARSKLKEVLLAEKLDRAALDGARLEIDALADRALDVGLAGVFELAEVLTPAQRRELAEHVARFER